MTARTSPTPPTAPPTIGAASRRAREAFGWIFALALSVATVSLIMGSARADLLFRDGDALLPVLIANSLQVGQPQDWAMSSVLFVPELAVFLPLSWLGLSATMTLALAGVVWFTALYGAIRVVAGRRRAGSSPVLSAALAHALFCVVALSESSPAREAADFASLLASSTYYAATVIACVATVGIVSRFASRPRPILLVALALVSALSMFTNPLYAVWGIFPVVVIGAISLRRRSVAPSATLVMAGAVGLAARLLLGDTIVMSGFGYIRPDRAFATVVEYIGAGGGRLAEPGGLIMVAVLSAMSIAALVAWRRITDPSRAFIAGIAGLAPALCLVAMIVMGGEVTRYLHPLVFFPVLALTLLRIPRGTTALGAIATGIAVVVAAVTGSAAVRDEAARTDPDLACVVSYAEASEDRGGGQFWTVRLPKSQLDDPRRLIQIDHELQGYEWLTNRDDYVDASIGYFLIGPDDNGDVEFAPVDADVLIGARELSCGRYTIVDLREPVPVATLRYAD